MICHTRHSLSVGSSAAVSHREAESHGRSLQRVAGLQWVVGTVVCREVVPAADVSLRLPYRLLQLAQTASEVITPGHLFEQLTSRGLLVGPPAARAKHCSEQRCGDRMLAGSVAT